LSCLALAEDGSSNLRGGILVSSAEDASVDVHGDRRVGMPYRGEMLLVDADTYGGAVAHANMH